MGNVDDGTSVGAPPKLKQRSITDEAGQGVARYDFLPFGEELRTPDTPCSAAVRGEGTRLRHGIDYVGARYYASGTGRFTTVDPALDIENALVNPQQWSR